MIGHPFANWRAVVKDFREFTVSRDHADALSLDRHRDAQALDAAEFEHGPAICTEPDCRQVQCIAYARHITDRRILATYPLGFQVAS